MIPVLFEGEVLAVIELATFDQFSPVHLTFLDQLTESIGIVLNTLQANSRTEELLKQSQSLTQELQTASSSCSRPTSAWSNRQNRCRFRKSACASNKTS